MITKKDTKELLKSLEVKADLIIKLAKELDKDADILNDIIYPDPDQDEGIFNLLDGPTVDLLIFADEITTKDERKKQLRQIAKVTKGFKNKYNELVVIESLDLAILPLEELREYRVSLDKITGMGIDNHEVFNKASKKLHDIYKSKGIRYDY